MALDIGGKAPDFRLPGTDGRDHALGDIAGARGTVIAFICNHCPYVLAVIDRIEREAEALREEGIGFAAICANDAERYPDDSFENMQAFAERHGLSFPYLRDESQEVARAYDAACTPEFHGFDPDLVLRYRGRLDASGRQPAAPDTRRELHEAMLAIAGGRSPGEQHAAMGCSIKWKTA
ncbi:MAG TPA: thioredoxin family protein [Thermohalobaculum sp.]|nr:thioredoxin family protein [Thermohalobaculum sp.]